MASDLEKFEQEWRVCRYDILAFCRLINFHPWSQQRDFLLAVQHITLNPDIPLKRVIAKSGQGLGKTAALVVAGAWRHFRSKGTLTLVVAPTERQAKEVFFAELRRIMSRAPQFLQNLCQIDSTQMIFCGQKGWKMLGVMAADPEKAAGWHHKTMTVLMEEISGMKDNIVDAFMGTCSQKYNALIAIGNPTKIQGHLYDAFNLDEELADELWPFRYTLSKLVLSQERPELADPAVIEGLRKQYGEDSDFWRVRVLGEFPHTSGDSVLNRALLDRAAKTPAWEAIRKAADPTIKRISLDFGGHGPNGDENAIYCRSGNAVIDWHVCQDPPYVALEKAWDMQKQLDWKNSEVMYVPDSVGVGQGMLHHLEKEGKQYLPYGSHHSGDPVHFNLESVAWFQAQKKFYEEIVSIPFDRKLIAQLASRTFQHATDSRLKVESKKDYKTRTKQDSPDRGDAFIQLFACDGISQMQNQTIC